MIAIFTSQCKKKAIGRTARVLDSFANRIGSYTWKTIITQEGLNAVKKLLKKTATKNTAVSCHVIHGNKSINLLWIVGNRRAFNHEGYIPVNSTSKDIQKACWENNWDYHPLIQSMVALASLFHDIGKANSFFQSKLVGSSKVVQDPLRHEWVSCLVFVAIIRVSGNTDVACLQYLEQGLYDLTTIYTMVCEIAREEAPFAGLPDYCFYVLWLILCHHRLPVGMDYKDFKEVPLSDLDSYKRVLKKEWGYSNQEHIMACLRFPNGLPLESEDWKRCISKWAKRSLTSYSLFEKAVSRNVLRPLICYSRFCLMFGDYSFSSLEKSNSHKVVEANYANTDSNGELKQGLVEHILGVHKEALSMAYLLPRFETDLEYAEELAVIDRKVATSSPYYWQDKAVHKINMWKQDVLKENTVPSYGFFAVNMASTGCGKTFANAKIMKMLSPDGRKLRFILALGLRTLTLQSGDEYRHRVGLDDSELAVIIGSQAVEYLHRQSTQEDDQYDEDFSFNGDIDYESSIPASRLSVIVKDLKSQKLLYSPVLACTIDYMMLATETIKGGRWLLPFLRLMSSDLVVDEVDDYSGKDLIAVGRLIHLAGLLGRKVMISSATISPDIAEAFFRAYRDGWFTFATSRGIDPSVGCAWVDEFRTVVNNDKTATLEDATSLFRTHHSKFTKTRVQNIQEHEQEYGAKRKGSIITCDHIFEETNDEKKEYDYYETIRHEAIKLHTEHSELDNASGVRVSFGCIRVANIDPCINLFKHLISADYPSSIEIRVMAYHSRQVLLVRSEQERHLDSVLKCKNGSRLESLSDPVIKMHIRNSKSKNLLFILVCTPIEEVGRDHDFDWAIVEPSSFRSIIQIAGRVRRHRTTTIDNTNIRLLQYSLKGLLHKTDSPVFENPGYETNQLMLETHNLLNLLDSETIANSINSCPRIVRSKELHPCKSLIDLEHYAISQLLTTYHLNGPESLEGWLCEHFWYLSGLPQKLSPFRLNKQIIQELILYYNGEDEPAFGVFDKGFIDKSLILNIKRKPLPQNLKERLWLRRDYCQLLSSLIERTGDSYVNASLKYGVIDLPEAKHGFEYSDDYGIQKVKI